MNKYKPVRSPDESDQYVGAHRRAIYELRLAMNADKARKLELLRREIERLWNVEFLPMGPKVTVTIRVRRKVKP